MADPVTRTQKGRVALLAIDNPPVNGLGFAVRQALQRQVTAALADPATAAIVIAGRGRMLSGGADIREFGKPQQEPILPQVLAVIEAADKPVVAAIHGHALGGGLELALACHYRVAARGARMALPEVTLGIVPGAGGTQRLPRLIGVKPALELMTTGEMVPAGRAQQLGLVDEVVDGDAAEAAVAFAERLVAEGRGPRRTSALDQKIADARAAPGLLAEFRQSLKRSARGQESPLAVVDCVEAAVTLPFAEGMKVERATFQRLVGSDQAAALRHAFFAEREAAKVKDVPEDTQAAPVARAGVLGLGTMGAGIAICFANAGIPVRVVEATPELLEKGLARIRQVYAGMVERKRLDQAEMDRRLALVAGTTRMEDLRDCDAVIEAVFEDMALKQDVFARLDAACPGAALLATNTSSLDVDAIAAATKRPERVIGMHFFSPANVMRLVETVRGKATARETIATAMALNKKLGKVAVVVGVCDSFVGNRMYYAYTRQAQFCLEEGALPQQVDKAIQDFGFPMGPFATGDLAGVDVGWRIRKQRAALRAAQGLPPDPRRYSPIADRIAEMGRYGQKTGAGWYRYDKGGRAPIPDPEIEKLIVQVSAEKGIARRAFSDREIVERCLFPLVNEGARILEEGIAQRASDIDVVWLYGYGFPRWRGGPMYWADRIGLDKVYAAMAKLYETDRDWCEPAPLLARLARAGKGFADL
jgi:3-hydroxyacyl-CoA dehydrogenase